MRTEAQFGPLLTPTGVTFRLWAPAAKTVELMLDSAYSMRARPDGWYELTIDGAGPYTFYKFRIDGEADVPDPASHFQPLDVFGPSVVVEHDAYDWQVPDWRGRLWEEAALLELH